MTYQLFYTYISVLNDVERWGDDLLTIVVLSSKFGDTLGVYTSRTNYAFGGLHGSKG